MDLEIFGRDAIVVKALPASLPEGIAYEIISDLADQLGDGQTESVVCRARKKILASLAWRAAIKANAVLSARKSLHMCRDLEKNSFQLNLFLTDGPSACNFLSMKSNECLKTKVRNTGPGW